MIKLNVAATAIALVLGVAGAANAGEGSVDSDNFGSSRYNTWNQTYSPAYPWGMEPGYSYGQGRYYTDNDSMTGFSVRRPMMEPYSDDDDDE